MVTKLHTSIGTALMVTAFAVGCAGTPPPEPDPYRAVDSSFLLVPESAEMNRVAPDLFHVRLRTTKGEMLLEVVREWSPLGVDHFFNLVQAGYYDGVRFHRVVDGQWAQFGINGEPETSNLWRSRTLPDEPIRQSNVRGTVAYAFAVPNGRTTQLFINLRDNSEGHDAEPFVPIARVVQGMMVADALNSEYGETAGGGIRAGRQGPLFEQGNAYLEANFPRLDFIMSASVETR